MTAAEYAIDAHGFFDKWPKRSRNFRFAKIQL
jgi:hypothetical protein